MPWCLDDKRCLATALKCYAPLSHDKCATSPRPPLFFLFYKIAIAFVHNGLAVLRWLLWMCIVLWLCWHCSLRLWWDRVLLALLLDLYICGIILLLETINCLFVFSESQNVFIFDFVATLKMFEGNSYTIFIYGSTSYPKDNFWWFFDLLDCTCKTIHIKWAYDSNLTKEAQLAFVVGRAQ
jgi:hypothetical protein